MNKIFISIASYRDPELINTLINLINCANEPDNLVIVVLEQNSDTDISIEGIFSQVKLLKMNYKFAKGPYYARYIIQKEYNEEEYYLQIDSHMRFEMNWDTTLKRMLNIHFKSYM